MRHQDDRAAVFVAGLAQGRDNLGLRGGVEGARGLVGQKDAGAQHEGAGDAHALGHAAGQLMGVGAQHGLGIGKAQAAEYPLQAIVASAAGDLLMRAD